MQKNVFFKFTLSITRRRLFICLIGFMIFLILYCLFSINIGFYDTKESVNYLVLRDSHETALTIGIDKSVKRENIIATLTKAANEHQYDGRDYYLSQHLMVKAYLVSDKQVSRIPAGVLIRFVLPLSEQGKAVINKPLRDFIFTSVAEAKLSIK